MTINEFMPPAATASPGPIALPVNTGILPPSPACTTPVSPSDTLVQNPLSRRASSSSKFSTCGTPTSPTSPSKTAVNSPTVSQDPSKETLEIQLPRPERMTLRLLAGLFVYFTCGWADGGTGTAMPYVKAEYKVTDMLSSTLFAAQIIGFGLGVVLIEPINNFLGRFRVTSSRPSIFPAFPHIISRKKGSIGHSSSQALWIYLTFFALLHGLFFLISGLNGGFYALLVAYVVSSFGRALMTAAVNGYVSTTPSKAFGYMLATWSLGAIISPFVFQTVVARGVHWPIFYLGSLVVPALNTFLLCFAFRPTNKEFAADQTAAEEAIKATQSDLFEISSAERTEKIPDVIAPAPENTFLKACQNSRQWLCSFFMFLYCACETTTQGFIMVYLISTRNADIKTVGYVTSGFWGGTLISRTLLGCFAPRFSFTMRKYMCHICILVALAMQLIILLVDSFIVNAAAASIIGLVYGPFYPAVLEMSSDLIPRDILLLSMALQTAFAQLGSALVPFIAGIMATYISATSIWYLLVALNSTLLIAFFIFPTKVPVSTPVVNQV